MKEEGLLEEKEPQRKYRRGEVVQNLVIILLLGIGLYLLVPRFIGEADMLDVVRHANFFMIPFALAVETLSMLAVCFLYYELQREGGGRLPFGRMSLIFMSAYAFGHVVPGGNAGTFYLNYVELRREGLSRTLIVKVLTAANLFYSGAMLFLVSAGLLASMLYPGLSSGYKLIALLLASTCLIFLLACFLLIRNEALLERLAHRMVRGLRRLGAWKEREENELVAGIMEIRHFVYVLITHRDSLLRNGFYALGYWCMDMACLFIVFIAIGTPVNPGVVIIAYAIADILGSLPLTPAGLGIFEIAMGATFYAYGYPKAVLVTAVLGFRFFSYWMCTLAGGICYVFLRLERRRERKRAA
jgi:uncharacterized protein (TIRG00374 family)